MRYYYRRLFNAREFIVPLFGKIFKDALGYVGHVKFTLAEELVFNIFKARADFAHGGV